MYFVTRSNGKSVINSNLVKYNLLILLVSLFVFFLFVGRLVALVWLQISSVGLGQNPGT